MIYRHQPKLVLREFIWHIRQSFYKGTNKLRKETEFQRACFAERAWLQVIEKNTL